MTSQCSPHYDRELGCGPETILVKPSHIKGNGESTCSKLQYDPYLISVACSNTELSISEKIWAARCKNTLLRWDKDHIEAYNMYFHVEYIWKLNKIF